jgi:UDP-N-acetylmuramate: L-alanyl-gamma-D-glutamyl-meso-diaminopimelate ligase
VPANGLILSPAADPNMESVLEMGCWSEQGFIGQAHKADWRANKIKSDCSEFQLVHKGKTYGAVKWSLIGEHNMENALMAVAAAHHAGVTVEAAIAALCAFKNVKRRMEIKGVKNGITVYDDFAHHPTAIQTTIEGLRHKVGNQKIIAIVEPRSNTMRMGIHKSQLSQAWEQADEVHLLEPVNLTWSLQDVIDNSKVKVVPHKETQSIVEQACSSAQPGDHILVMSNGGFENIHQRIIDKLGDNEQ